MALHSETRIPTTMPMERARPLLAVMRFACSVTMPSTFAGTTSLSSEMLPVIVDVLKNSP